MRQVIIVKGKKYAVGLIWQPMGIGIVARSFAIKIRSNIKSKVNLYSEYRAMVCMGSGSLGHRVGMSIAAAEVIEYFSEFASFLSVFNYETGFWLLAVRNGIVLKDSLFDDEISAQTEYKKFMEIPDWAAVFAPESWGIARSIEKPLAEVILGNLKVSLKPISRIKADLISFILFASFVLAVAYFFKAPIGKMIEPKPQISKIDPILAEKYKKQLESKNKELNKEYAIGDGVAVAEPLVMPYDILPNPDARARLCYKAIAFLMQPVPGWNQTDIECRETYAGANFKRGFGNLGDFYELVPDLMPSAAITSQSESLINVAVNLPLLPASASLDERDADTIIRDVNTVFQRLNSTVDINMVVDIVSDNVQSVNLNVIEVSAKSKLIPPEFMKIFGDFSGVYMNLAAWNAADKTWNYEVIIYAK